MDQGGRSHRTGPNLKTIMLSHTFRRTGKGMLATKIRQYPLQSFRPSPWPDAYSLKQRAQVTPSRAAPDPFTHFHQTKDAPPFQRFFLRLRTVGSWLWSSVLTRSSAWVAQWVSVRLPNWRISSINSSSTSSAVFNGPSSWRAVFRMH